MPERKVSFFWTVFALLGLTWCVAFVVSVVEYATQATVISRFALSWELARTGTRFFSWLPALVFSSCAVVANLASRDSGGRGKTTAIAGGAAAMALAVGAALVFLAPVARAGQITYETRSRLFLESRTAAEKAFEAKDYATALDQASLAESVDPTEPTLRALKDKALAEANRLVALPPKESTAERAPERIGLSASDFLRIALEAEANGDWYTAHYEAGEALQLDPRMAEARLLQARAWERIRALAEDPELAERSGFFARKLAAYASFREGDSLRAWREFTELNSEFPRDPDVLRYLRESELALRDLAYFADEARTALADHPSGPVLARLGEDGTLLVLSATKSAAAGSSLWLERPELLAVSDEAVLWHVGASYGLLESDVLLLRGVDGKEAEAPVLEPATYHGAPPWEAPGALAPPLSPEDAVLVAGLGEDFSTLGPGSLLEAARVSERFGLHSAPYADEFARRMGALAVTLALALIGAGLGTRLKSPRRPGALSSISGLALIAGTTAPIIAAIAGTGASLLSAFRAALDGPGAWLAWGVCLAVTMLAGVTIAARYLTRG